MSIIISIIIISSIIIIISIITSLPYVHVIEVLSTTAGYGISRDQSKRSYGVERSFGASRPQPKKEKKGGGEKVEPILG
jgi:hypothetical protein